MASQQPLSALFSPLEGSSVWTGDDLAPADGLVRIPAEALSEITGIAGVLKDNPLPFEALRPEDFDIPACRMLMAAVRETLDHGVGFALIDRLPLDDMAPASAKAVYWLLSAMLARPVAQKWDGTMIYDVRDTGKKPGNGVRPDITNAEQNFHTDNSYNLCPPDYVGLLCVNPTLEGGISGVVSLHAVYNAMLVEHPELVERLYRDFIFDRQREHAPGDAMTLRHPLFELRDGDLAGRLSRFQVKNGYALAEETPDEEGLSALEALEDIMNRPGMAKTFAFERGQIQILDNRRCAHRRTGFTDGADAAHKRHLIRLWLRDSGRPFYNG